ncbi:MAG: hypothetical protein FJ387_24015 [Verrucomicrobia bacterium]|nr:hypothetical protein [Verrucomicrobiota bacterium]
MMDAELLQIMCCPETHQKLAVADTALLDQLNQRIAQGQVRNRQGEPVREKLDGALVRADGKYLYPVRQDIPIMLIDEAIPLLETAP